MKEVFFLLFVDSSTVFGNLKSLLLNPLKLMSIDF
jgi:hypothetical protein